MWIREWTLGIWQLGTFYLKNCRTMKKLERLIEIKKLLALAEAKRKRAEDRMVKLAAERKKVLSTITADEARLYKERILRACEQ